MIKLTVVGFRVGWLEIGDWFFFVVVIVIGKKTVAEESCLLPVRCGHVISNCEITEYSSDYSLYSSMTVCKNSTFGLVIISLENRY